MGFAFIAEIVEEDENLAMVLTGRFVCEAGGAAREFDTLGKALAWAGEGATRIDVELEGERYSATGGSHLDPLPPAVIERAARGRRRLPGEEWRDRTAADPPIEWLVDLQLHPGEIERDGPVRAQQEAMVAAAVEALRAGRYRDVEILAGELDEGIQEIEDQDPGTGDYGWTTDVSLAYEIGAQCAGRTLKEVVDAAVGVAAAALEGQEWTVSATARPVGAPPSRRWMV
jgi:hypothetical protein